MYIAVALIWLRVLDGEQELMPPAELGHKATSA
jgi:hypothetical protein